MESEYLIIPKYIGSNELLSKSSLSASDYITLDMPNKNFLFVKDFINKPISGKEVGSKEYIKKSNKKFIRTKALTKESYLLNYECESITPIKPQAFIDKKLKEGDILLSKDSNIGEVIILEKDLPDYAISGGLKILRAKKDKYYLFAFLKSDFFKNQVILMTPRGATMKHAKELWLEAKIPYPNQKNSKDVIDYIVGLVKTRIKKEEELRNNYLEIMRIILEELDKNQNSKSFYYSLPNIKNLKEELRLDAGMFCEDYKKEQFKIENYVCGAKDIFSLGFDFNRGQNLQISQIGRSIYSNKEKPNFYKLIRPINLSDFGTVGSYEYLGSQKTLQTINKGEIIFSAEGTIGKFCVFVDVDDRTITNIHGITIFRKEEDDIESAFLGLFLGYLRKVGVLDYISVGGQGGSLAQMYWKNIKIPNFPRKIKEDLAKKYYSGILKLDNQIKSIGLKIEDCIKKISHDEEVNIK